MCFLFWGVSKEGGSQSPSLCRLESGANRNALVLSDEGQRGRSLFRKISPPYRLFLVCRDFDMQLVQLSLRDLAGSALPKTDGAVLGTLTGLQCSAEMNSACAKVLLRETLIRAGRRGSPQARDERPCIIPRVL